MEKLVKGIGFGIIALGTAASAVLFIGMDGVFKDISWYSILSIFLGSIIVGCVICGFGEQLQVIKAIKDERLNDANELKRELRECKEENKALERQVEQLNAGLAYLIQQQAQQANENTGRRRRNIEG